MLGIFSSYMYCCLIALWILSNYRFKPDFSTVQSTHTSNTAFFAPCLVIVFTEGKKTHTSKVNRNGVSDPKALAMSSEWRLVVWLSQIVRYHVCLCRVNMLAGSSNSQEKHLLKIKISWFPQRNWLIVVVIACSEEKLKRNENRRVRSRGKIKMLATKCIILQSKISLDV